MRPQQGFTLLEVMIVVAIIAILAAIAIPTYTSYVQRSNITEATSQLSSAAVSMEQYFQDNRQYSASQCPGATKNFTYAATCTVTPTTYSITATGSSTLMTGFSYTIDQTGAKSSVITASGWTGSANCWAIKQDGSC